MLWLLCKARVGHAASPHLGWQPKLVRHVCLGAPPEQAPQGGLEQRQQAGAPCGADRGGTIGSCMTGGLGRPLLQKRTQRRQAGAARSSLCRQTS